jgi:putative ubiquitin-RnfH superfamily antitoxin RatB of RatAB toxin-antitoxin module
VPDSISIEVTYALPDKQTLLALRVAPQTTVEEALEQSGILKLHSDIDLTKNKVGIWYKATKLTTTLNDGDRIEIYRPLIADPKEVRKKRAQKAVDEGRANKVTGGKTKSSDKDAVKNNSDNTTKE